MLKDITIEMPYSLGIIHSGSIIKLAIEYGLEYELEYEAESYIPVSITDNDTHGRWIYEPSENFYRFNVWDPDGGDISKFYWDLRNMLNL